MPIKHNLTRYDVLKDQIHRVSSKEERLYTDDDKLLRDMATIVAAFSSGQSWRTHRELDGCGMPDFSSQEIRDEYMVAAAQKWRNISPFDIGEVAQRSISEEKFRRWLYYNVPRERHVAYSAAWSNLNKIVGRDEGIEELVSGVK